MEELTLFEAQWYSFFRASNVRPLIILYLVSVPTHLT